MDYGLIFFIIIGIILILIGIVHRNSNNISIDILEEITEFEFDKKKSNNSSKFNDFLDSDFDI